VTVHFHHDSYNLTPESLAILDTVVAVMKTTPSLGLELVGHSDPTGALRYNVWVSEFRANIVKSYLIGKGIASEEMKITALGPADPIAPNTTREGRLLNRRVEIKFVQTPPDH